MADKRNPPSYASPSENPELSIYRLSYYRNRRGEAETELAMNLAVDFDSSRYNPSIQTQREKWSDRRR